MEIKQDNCNCSGIKLSVLQNNKEIGRARLYIMYNDLHKEPFGLLEDLFIDENSRGKGIGTELLNKIIELAKEKECYKLIATSRHSRENVHVLYNKHGFKNHGLEFRIDF